LRLRILTHAPVAVGVLLFLSLLTASPLGARIKPVGFEIPIRMQSLESAATPTEYAQLEVAIKTWEREHAQEQQEGEGLGDLSRIEATRVNLGPLGEGMVVSFGNSSPPCGASGNCPMTLIVHGAQGYRLAFMSDGWGYALLPSGGPVPDIAFYSHMSASESDAQVLHYAHGQFGATSSAACTAGNSSNPICAPVGNTAETTQGALSPAEYSALRPAVEANLQEQSPASTRRFSIDDTHGLGVFLMQLVSATAVGVGPCGVNRNCNISIYAHHREDRTYWPLLRNVTGWGVASGTIIGAAPTQVAFVIARHLSADQDLLTRYVVPLATANHLGDLTRSSRLLPDACETVTPRSGHRPAQWDAAALVAQPAPCFKTTSSEQAQTPAADTTKISAVAQDGDGTVWAAGGEHSEQLYRWRDGGWSEVPNSTLLPRTSPQQLEYLKANFLIPQLMDLWPGPSNGVVMLWFDPATQKSDLFWQRRDQSKLLAAVPPIQPGTSLDIKAVASAASGIVVITGDQRAWRNGAPVSGQAPGVFRFAENAQLERIYTIEPDQYLPSRIPVNDIPNFMPLSVTRDGQGKVWIWCGWSRPLAPREAALGGFLVTDGKTVQYHRSIPGLPMAHLVSLDVWDNGHLAAATFGGGLCTIDTVTFEAQPVAEPQPGAFRFAKKVFSAGNDRYVLTFVPDENGRIRQETTGVVWRLREGKWTQIPGDVSDASGVGLATAGGLWLGTSDFRGLWLIPAQGPARRLSAEQGLPLAHVQQLFQLPGGQILATEAGQFVQTRSAEFNPEALLRQTVTSRDFTVVYPGTVLQPDRERNLWGIIQPGVLSEWVGSQWIPHPFPPLIAPSHIVGLDIDTQGRVWLFPDCRLGPMGFFDPAENRWTTYQDYRIALAHRAGPVRFLHPEDDHMRPIYGPDSQIMFVGMCGGVSYFDGSYWHLWNRPALPGPLYPQHPPFFDAAGHPAFDPQPGLAQSKEQFHRQGSNTPATWEWTPDSRWHIVPYEPAAVVPLPNPFAPRPPPPAGCETMSPSSLVYDPTGRAWWIADDALYTGTTGECHPVLSGSAAQPFIDGRDLASALLDGRGNIFLETQTPFSYVILRRSLYAEPAQANAAEVKERVSVHGFCRAGRLAQAVFLFRADRGLR